MKELPKVYDPKQVEKKIYDMWEKGGYFTPKPDPEKHTYPRRQCDSRKSDIRRGVSEHCHGSDALLSHEPYGRAQRRSALCASLQFRKASIGKDERRLDRMELK